MRLGIVAVFCGVVAIGAGMALAAPGDVDHTFAPFSAPGVSLAPAAGVALQADGRLVVAGQSCNPDCYGSNADFAVVRLLSDGTLDASFGSGGVARADFDSVGEVARDLILQPDGHIVVGGSAYASLGMARYDAVGALDPTFGTGGKVVSNLSDVVTRMILQPDGKIVAAGRARILRFASDGTVDSSFGTGGVVDTSLLFNAEPGFALQPDGKILLATSTGGFENETFAIARLNPDGSLDSTFGGSGIVSTPFGAGPSAAGAVLGQPDGKIVVGGHVLTDVWPIDSFGFALARYLADGTLDLSFGTNGQATMFFDDAQDAPDGDGVGMLLRDVDGNLLAAGRAHAARFRPDGKIDATFGIGGHARTAAGPRAAVQPDGRLITEGGSVERYETACAPSPDADGDGIPDSCDACVGGVGIDDVHVAIARLSDSVPGQNLTARGRLTFAAAPAVDPLAHGIRVLLRDSSGAVVFDILVPGGPFNSVDGWKANAAHTSFHYKPRQRTGYRRDKGIRGIRSIAVTRAGNVVRFKMTGKTSDYRVPESALPVTLTVVFDPPYASGGLCGEVVLATPGCVFKGTGRGRGAVCS